MSKYGYVGKESDIPQQAFKANAGVLSVNDHLALSQEDKLTQFGQLELIETQTFSGVTFVDFTDLQESTYNVHFGIWTNQRTDSTNVRQFEMLFYENGVLETGNAYEYALQYGLSTGSFGVIQNTADSALEFAGGTNNNTNENTNGYFYIYNAGDNSKFTFVTAHTVRWRGGNATMRFGGGLLPQKSVVDGFRFRNPLTETIQGTVSLYGIRYS
jgi:hypothetical protein